MCFVYHTQFHVCINARLLFSLEAIILMYISIYFPFLFILRIFCAFVTFYLNSNVYSRLIFTIEWKFLCFDKSEKEIQSFETCFIFKILVSYFVLFLYLARLSIKFSVSHSRNPNNFDYLIYFVVLLQSYLLFTRTIHKTPTITNKQWHFNEICN